MWGGKGPVARGPFSSSLPQPAPPRAPSWSDSKNLPLWKYFHLQFLMPVTIPAPQHGGHPRVPGPPCVIACPPVAVLWLWQSRGWVFFLVYKETEAQRGEATGSWSRRGRVRIQSLVLCSSPRSKLVLGCLPHLSHGPGLPTEPGVPRRKMEWTVEKRI